MRKDLNETKKQTANVRQSSVGWLVKTVAAKYDKALKKQLDAHGLNPGHFAIMMTLLEQDGVTQAAIGKRVSMPSYATTRNIDALENLGLLERAEDETSRRNLSIRVTAKGRALAPTLFASVRQVNAQALSRLDDGEIEQLKILLSKVDP